MPKTQYPASVTDFQVKFGRYSLKDLARITVPTLLSGLAAGVPGAAAGLLGGVMLAEYTRHGKTVDQVAKYQFSYQLDKRQLDVEGQIEDNVVQLSDGTVIGLVEVKSVDLDMASNTRWDVNRGVISELYKELEEPVEIHSRKRTVNLDQYKSGSSTAVTTDHYVAIRESRELETKLPWKDTVSVSAEERAENVVDRCTKVRNTLNSGDLSAEHVTGDHLKQVVDRFKYPDLSVEKNRYKVGSGETDHRRLLCITGYPEQLEAGILSDLLNLNVPGFVEVVQNVEPVTEDQRQKLSRLLGRMQVESTVTPDQIRGSDIGRKVADTQKMLEAELTGNERLVNHASYIVVCGDSWEEVEATSETVTRFLRRHSIDYEEPWLETPAAVQTESLVRDDALQRSLVMPSLSAASCFSFSTHDKIESNGVVFGTDTRNGLPVILDRYSWEAGDNARMGKKGSGKSYSAKLMLNRSLHRYPGLQVYILDPKQEYGVIGDAFNGSCVVLDDTDLSRLDDLDDRVVRYTVKDRSQDNTENLVRAVEHIYRSVSQDQSKKIVLIDEAWHLLNDPRGRKAVSKLVREGRDVNACVELVTQNASDFTRSQEGRDILKNLNSYIFFKHQDVASDVSEFFNLSQKEAVELRQLPTGTDVPYSEAIIRGPVNTKLRVNAQPQEHAVITAGGDR